jgi:hypothetical protein
MDISVLLFLSLISLLFYFLPVYYLGKIAERTKDTNALLNHIIDKRWGAEEGEQPAKKVLKKK